MMKNIVRRTAFPVLVAGVYAALIRPRLLRWGTTGEEESASYPGDDLIRHATAQSTMAVSLPAPPEEVWPWLIQMGSGRAGWYSWDFLDNAGGRSADQIVPEWQDLAVGARIPAVPSGAFHFLVEILDPLKTLVLRFDLELPSGRSFDPGGPMPAAYTDGIWAFHLRPLPDGGTRLIIRTRGCGKPAAADRLVGRLFGEPAHFIMQHRQFRNLRRRVRRADPAAQPTARDAEQPDGAGTFDPAPHGSA
ncbi:SRPBCC family protein [Actinomadura chokoriensis]|uniref:SRPBCC family protein n=1 Tax=Actinomadura chokoriensis TaxID=454156 RepID=UPI0031F933B0